MTEKALTAVIQVSHIQDVDPFCRRPGARQVPRS